MALRRGIPGISAGAARLPGDGRTVGVMEVRLFGKLEALDGGVLAPVCAFFAHVGYDELGSDDAQGWPVQPSFRTRYAAPCWKRPSR